MEIIMFPANRIEDALVRLEERALELTMCELSPLAVQEFKATEAESARLRMMLFGGQHSEEYVRRLNRIDAEVICIKQRWRMRHPSAA